MIQLRFVKTTILFLAAISYISAQTNYQAGVSLGVSQSTIASDLFTTSSGRTGIAAGFSFALGFGERFELNPEFMFVQKGATAKAVRFMPEEQIAAYDFDYHFNSIEVGLMAGYQLGKEFPVRVQAGGYFGSHTQTNTNKSSGLCIKNYEDPNKAIEAYKINQAFSGMDFGPAVGISAGSGQFRFNVRYYHGLKNMYNNLDFVAAGPSIRNRSFRATLTYFLK